MHYQHTLKFASKSYFHSTVHLLDFGNQIQLEITVKVPIFRFKRFYLIISYLY